MIFTYSLAVMVELTLLEAPLIELCSLEETESNLITMGLNPSLTKTATVMLLLSFCFTKGMAPLLL